MVSLILSLCWNENIEFIEQIRFQHFFYKQNVIYIPRKPRIIHNDHINECITIQITNIRLTVIIPSFNFRLRAIITPIGLLINFFGMLLHKQGALLGLLLLI